MSENKEQKDSEEKRMEKTFKVEKFDQFLAVDCEMVGVGAKYGPREDALARVSLVNSSYKVVYDEYVKPDRPVTDYRTNVSGIKPNHLVGAKHFDVVQTEVRNLLNGKIVVGHSLENDLGILQIHHPYKMRRDTAKFYRHLGGRRWPPSLKKLALVKLGKNIQGGSHSSIEDAKTCMEIYNKVKAEWEKRY